MVDYICLHMVRLEGRKEGRKEGDVTRGGLLKTNRGSRDPRLRRGCPGVAVIREGTMKSRMDFIMMAPLLCLGLAVGPAHAQSLRGSEASVNRAHRQAEAHQTCPYPFAVATSFSS